jgi:cytochrome P450
VFVSYPVLKQQPQNGKASLTEMTVLSEATSFAPLLLAFAWICALVYDYLSKPSLRNIPGPASFAITRYRLAFEAWQARSIQTVHKLHHRYGPVVRIGPDEVSFNSLSALRQIYGAGSGFERTAFYKMFDVYGRANLFTFSSGKDHRERKKLISHIYSNQVVLSSNIADLVPRKVSDYLQMLEQEPDTASEIFASLHYFSIDAISEFVYGSMYGGTHAMARSSKDRGLLNDILDHSRRRLSWFAVHFPALTKWITTRKGILDRLITNLGLLPMNRPFTYTGIRNHALQAFFDVQAASADERTKLAETTVIGRLMKVQQEQGLNDMDIASECADHLLAGIDTTADTLMFLIWAMSLPHHHHFQARLRAELQKVPADSRGVSTPKDLAHLPYLTAVIRETLRLYAPLPAFEPRALPNNTVIDGYLIPANTVVGMSPYCLHREPTVFPDPLIFNPGRWLTEEGSLIAEADPRNRWFWPFSSGARMCIGMHLANAEMFTLTAAIFRNYQTSVRHPDVSPGITSRFEIFCDETMPKVLEHECWIDFVKMSPSASVVLPE